jgi:hypothetical protein
VTNGDPTTVTVMCGIPNGLVVGYDAFNNPVILSYGVNQVDQNVWNRWWRDNSLSAIGARSWAASLWKTPATLHPRRSSAGCSATYRVAPPSASSRDCGPGVSPSPSVAA